MRPERVDPRSHGNAYRPPGGKTAEDDSRLLGAVAVFLYSPFMGHVELGPEDRGDVIWVGSIGPIRVGYDDDPRVEAVRPFRHDANVIAQGLHSADELLDGLTHDNEWVRYESIPRLVARWGSDPRVEARLLQLIVSDDSTAVREHAIMQMLDYEPRQELIDVISSQGRHPDTDVRESVDYVLSQWALTDPRAGRP